jgi:hypothetical protein
VNGEDLGKKERREINRQTIKNLDNYREFNTSNFVFLNQIFGQYEGKIPASDLLHEIKNIFLPEVIEFKILNTETKNKVNYFELKK